MMLLTIYGHYLHIYIFTFIYMCKYVRKNNLPESDCL